MKHVILYNTVYRMTDANYKRFLRDIRDDKSQPIDAYKPKTVIVYAENISEISSEQAGWYLEELEVKAPAQGNYGGWPK